jgi:hypothetical protein
LGIPGAAALVALVVEKVSALQVVPIVRRVASAQTSLRGEQVGQTVVANKGAVRNQKAKRSSLGKRCESAIFETFCELLILYF